MVSLVFSQKEQTAVHPALPLYRRLPEKLLVLAQSKNQKESIFAMKNNVWRAVIEVGFIIFLFYSNLLMGEFERSGMGQKRGVAWANRRCSYRCQFCHCHHNRAHRL
jgi:hypothetical protein